MKRKKGHKNISQCHLPTKRAAATVNLDRKKIVVRVVILSQIYVTDQILPVMYATCGVSQSSTQGFETDKIIVI